MRAYVFTDPAFAKHARRFVWLSVDTEKEQNAGFLERFPLESWPTLWVIDSRTETVAVKWIGSATAAQLEKLFDDADRSLWAKAGGNAAEDALARADRLYGERRAGESATAYREALAAAPADWPRRPRTLESLMVALSEAGDRKGCAEAGRQEAPGLPRGPSFANATLIGLYCALFAPKEASWRKEALAALEPLAREGVGLPGILADDRSGLYEALVEALEELGDDTGAKALAGEWLAFLEKEAARAPTPEARAAFDPHRLSAALKLGEASRAVAALQASERDVPSDYNAPARLAIAYRELGRYGEALEASQRALAKVYGPRRLRILETKAGILLKKGDRAGAIAVLAEALQFADSLPKPQRPEATIARIRAEHEKQRAAGAQ